MKLLCTKWLSESYGLIRRAYLIQLWLNIVNVVFSYLKLMLPVIAVRTPSWINLSSTIWILLIYTPRCILRGLAYTIERIDISKCWAVWVILKSQLARRERLSIAKLLVPLRVQVNKWWYISLRWLRLFDLVSNGIDWVMSRVTWQIRLVVLLPKQVRVIWSVRLLLLNLALLRH